MAAGNPKDELSALGLGVDIRSLAKNSGNSWEKNVLWRNGRYESRGGMGLLAQYSTTLSGGRDTEIGTGVPFGYGDTLGAFVFLTDEKHIQILSVHKLHAFTGNFETQETGVWLAGTQGQILDLVAVNVYDYTSDRRTEFVLHRGTQELTGGIDLPKVYPHYQSTLTPSQWVVTDASVTTANFTQLSDCVYITIPTLGVWVYRPTDPGQSPNREIDSLDVDTDTATPARNVGESSALQRVILAEGFSGLIAGFTAGYTYLTDSEFSPPTCTTSYQGRLIYASGKTLWFSDPDQPSHVISDNVFLIPSELPITAMADVKGTLLIWTERETWLYQPNQGDALISGGRIYNLSNNIGCMSQNHVAQGDQGVFWLDGRGIYASQGGTQITRLSEPIDPWFSQPEAMQDPASSYMVNSGLTTLADTQPRARIDLVNQLSFGNLTWDQQNRILYCTAKDLSLVWTQSAGWSVWMYETACDVVSGTPRVGLTQKIQNPLLQAIQGNIFLIGGPDEVEYTDATPGDITAIDKSYYILLLGRGGSLDRSSANQENRRTPVGSWQRYLAGFLNPGGPDFYFGQPVKLPFGFKTALPQTTTEDIWLQPIYIANNVPDTVASYAIRFTFDATHWRCLNTGVSVGDIDYLLPPERLASDSGYHAGVGLVASYLAGVLSNNGSEVRIAWDGVAAAGAWAHAPNLNLNKLWLNPIIYLPFKRLTPTHVGETVLQFGIVPEILILNHLTSPDTGNCYIWKEIPDGYPVQSLANDAQAQPMDWALKTRSVGDGKVQIKARGTYVTMESHGKSNNPLVPGWIFTVYNTLTGADDRDFAQQANDFTSSPPGEHVIQDKTSIRARLQPPLANSVSLKTGSNVAKWGDVTDSTKGNLLIDDPAVDTIATSEGVRGETFSTMVFGTLNAPAELVKVQTVDIAIRVVGGRRRSGR